MIPWHYIWYYDDVYAQDNAVSFEFQDDKVVAKLCLLWMLVSTHWIAITIGMILYLKVNILIFIVNITNLSISCLT